MVNMMNVGELDRLFQIYGYDVKETNASYRVYLLNQGMYHGAEIQVMDETDAAPICARYSKLGYHAKEQHFKSVNEAEDYLFRGFFNTQTTSYDIERRYSEFASNQVRLYGDASIKYRYISMPYSVCSSSLDEYIQGNTDIISAIKDVMSSKGAYLIVVEAAAGFGKTCTAYEVYNAFVDKCDKQKPIFTELSRNRDAKQFKYILWSEIDREKDTTAKQELVVYNIKKGKIPLIIDGFDELLSKDIDPGKAGQLNEFEQVETMLSTIGDLLTDESKIVLTSRKTAIFAGTEFGDWIDSYGGKFNVIRFQLEKPNIKQWLSESRYSEIENRGIALDGISNPVLLTYLRNIDQGMFEDLLNHPDTITDKYFEYLLNREKERQNITIPWEEQMQIFENLARSFAEFDITGDTRSFVKDLIISENKEQLLRYREFMLTQQTLDELADTLTNHALLDRVGNKDYIGFVNEFVLGYLLAKSIQNSEDNFLCELGSLPEGLIELAVISYENVSRDDKSQLWAKLLKVTEKMSLPLKITTECSLMGEVQGSFESQSLNSITFRRIKFFRGKCCFTEFSFVDAVFDECIFDRGAFLNVTFVGCKFNKCVVRKDQWPGETKIHCYGCEDYNSGFITSLEIVGASTTHSHEDVALELQILAKYFKVDGRTPKMRYISSLRKEFEGQDLDAVFAVFNMLKKKGMILTQGNNSYISKAGINYYHKNV